MVGKWRDCIWGDLVSLEYGKSLRNYENSNGHFRVYGTNGPIGWHDSPLCNHPGVIIGRKGAYRGVHFSPAPFFVIDTAFFVEPKEELDARWIYYSLLTYDINGMDSGSAIPSTSRESFYRLPVRIPLLSEQRAIAHILGTLDDKIELNRKINETLEAMARALFKSWFVDFDPIRAKAEGRSTGLPKHIADLFPDSFVDSELGEIPKEWKVSTIGFIAEVIDCLHSKKPERLDAGKPFLQLVNIRDDGLIDMKDTYFIDEIDYRKWVSRMEASPGDCVITNVGRVGAVAQMPLGQMAALGRNMTGVRCKSSFPYPTFLIECLLSQSMRDEIIRKMDSGTILDALNVRNIPKLRFTRPPDAIARIFEETVRPLRAQMEMLLNESHTLAALRDTLLPKLISGELHVKDAEVFVGRNAC